MHYNTMNTIQKNTLTKLNMRASPVLATRRLVNIRKAFWWIWTPCKGVSSWFKRIPITLMFIPPPPQIYWRNAWTLPYTQPYFPWTCDEVWTGGHIFVNQRNVLLVKKRNLLYCENIFMNIYDFVYQRNFHPQFQLLIAKYIWW